MISNIDDEDSHCEDTEKQDTANGVFGFLGFVVDTVKRAVAI